MDPALVGAVMLDSGRTEATHTDARAIDVSRLDAGLLDAVVRLVRLVNSPGEAQFLAPLVTREIIFRLLTGKQGDRLRETTKQNDGLGAA